MYNKNKMISGAWYNDQYASADSIYGKIYRSGIPEWAIKMNLWHVDLGVALLQLDPRKDTILDLGSGMGYYINAWESRGFKVVGVDISSEAIKLSGKDNIVCTPLNALSMFEDGQFSVAFSGAVLEHIDDSVMCESLSEIYRVSNSAIHYIGHEVGHDPGHINIKTPDEWGKYFSDFFKGGVITPYQIDNVCNINMPAFVHDGCDRTTLKFTQMKRKDYLR